MHTVYLFRKTSHPIPCLTSKIYSQIILEGEQVSTLNLSILPIDIYPSTLRKIPSDRLY
jgi:hypothetical protein